MEEYDGISEEELAEASCPGEWSDEYKAFVKHHQGLKNSKPLSMTGNQIAFAEFLLKNPKSVVIVGDMTLPLQKVQAYLKSK